MGDGAILLPGVVADEPAGIEVHRSSELEARGERRCAPDPGDRDPPLLERLAKRFEHVPPELRQLAEKQDAVIGGRSEMSPEIQVNAMVIVSAYIGLTRSSRNIGAQHHRG